MFLVYAVKWLASHFAVVVIVCSLFLSVLEVNGDCKYGT